MASGGTGGNDRPQWVLARDRTRPGTIARNVLGVVAVLVAVVAALALLNSFFVDLAPGEPVDTPGDPSPGDESEAQGGGSGRDPCQVTERALFWAFAVLGVAAIVLFGVAVARREHHAGRIGSSPWGILSVVAVFLSALAYGLWRLVAFLCSGDASCAGAEDGSGNAFAFLLAVTILGFGGGIAMAHVQRRNFLTTGWGLLGLLMALPTMVLGFTWYLVKTACADTLTCATRNAFLDTLGLTAWLAVAGAVVALAAGVYVGKRWRMGFMRSGWGVLMIVLIVLAAFAGAGWMFAKNVTAPICEEVTPETPEERTCEETRDDLRQRLGWAMLVVLAGVVVLGGVGAYLHRGNMRAFWSSPWAIGVYVGLVLLVLLGILYLMAGSMCADPGEPGDPGNGDGTGGGSGTGDGTGGGGGGGQGAGGGGQGPGTGGGGGDGGTGSARPVEFDPQSLQWALLAILAVLGVAAIVVGLTYWRSRLGAVGDDAAAAAAQSVKGSERAQLMRLLGAGGLESDQAVVAAYRAFLAWSAARGHGIDLDETPREHARRVGAAYRLPPGEMDRFIGVYELARLSARKPSPVERDAAVRFSESLGDATREEDA